MNVSDTEAEAQAEMIRTWEKHLESEFGLRSPEATLATMTSDPHLIIVPTLIGGRNRDEVGDFYANQMLTQIPPDIEIVPVSRTVGKERLVDELVVRFTHTLQMDWVLPGIPPTGKRIELALAVIVHFVDGKIASEHLYWDNATLLYQAGLLTDPTLPLVGAESAQQVLDPTGPHRGPTRR